MEKIHFYPYKIFVVNGKEYLYSVNVGGLFEINAETKRILEMEGYTEPEIISELESIIGEKQIIEMIQNMRKYNFIRSPQMIDSKEVGDCVENKISSLTLMVSQECNMRCRYCYGDGGEYNDKGKMKENVAYAAIEYLFHNTNAKEVWISLLGGEPLMNYKLVQQIVEFAEKSAEKYNIKVNFSMTTNGTLLDKQIEAFIIKHKISTQISIDGNKKQQDANRYFINNKGSYDMVIKKTEALRKKGVLSARATVTSSNLKMKEIFQHLESLNFRSIPIAAAQNMLTEEQFECLIEENSRQIEYFAELVRTGNIEKAKKMVIIYNALKRIHYGSQRDLPCGVGKNMYAVDINGDLFPCHRFVANKEFKLGNVFTGVDDVKVKKFLESIKVDNHSQCEKCWARNLCIGGCPNENYVNGGSVDKSTKGNCKYMRSMYSDLIYLYLKLTEEERAKLF